MPVVRFILQGQGRHWLLSEKHPGSRDIFWGLDVDGRRVEFGPVSLEMLGRLHGFVGQPPRGPLSYFVELLRVAE